MERCSRISNSSERRRWKVSLSFIRLWFAIWSLSLNCLSSLRAEEKGAVSCTIGGSGTNLPLIRLLAQAFTDKNPTIHLKIFPSIGSTGGIKAVHKGKIALALASRPLRDIEKSWNLKVVPYAQTILVFGVNSSVREDDIGQEEVLAIYSAKKTRWKDNSPIRVIMREEGDSGAEVLVKNIPELREIFERAWTSGIWRIEYRDSDCNKTIEKLKGSIGWADLGSIQIDKINVEPLKYNGVAPTTENLNSGKYPLYKELFFVYQEPLPGQLKKFVEFVASSEGAEIIRRNNYVPLQ